MLVQAGEAPRNYEQVQELHQVGLDQMRNCNLRFTGISGTVLGLGVVLIRLGRVVALRQGCNCRSNSIDQEHRQPLGDRFLPGRFRAVHAGQLTGLASDRSRDLLFISHGHVQQQLLDVVEHPSVAFAVDWPSRDREALIVDGVLVGELRVVGLHLQSTGQVTGQFKHGTPNALVAFC